MVYYLLETLKTYLFHFIGQKNVQIGKDPDRSVIDWRLDPRIRIRKKYLQIHNTGQQIIKLCQLPEEFRRSPGDGCNEGGEAVVTHETVHAHTKQVWQPCDNKCSSYFSFESSLRKPTLQISANFFSQYPLKNILFSVRITMVSNRINQYRNINTW
jgi:hypothetical protein